MPLKNLVLVLGLFGLAGCSAFQLSPEELAHQKELRQRARSVLIANAITVTELRQYRELGPVECSATRFASTAAETLEECRKDLKMDAARLGGNLVVVESTRWESDAKVQISGRAYQSVAK
ncbi:MAG: hypothetical protein HY075_09055 [Deltaproteobacteria bacterium]|nr:hypothetical protein [Deltaproteobacteria bacterium]